MAISLPRRGTGQCRSLSICSSLTRVHCVLQADTFGTFFVLSFQLDQQLVWILTVFTNHLLVLVSFLISVLASV